MKRVRLPILFVICTATPSIAGDVASTNLPFTIAPPAVEMGSFFDGETIAIDGTVDTEAAVIVTLSGGNKEQRFICKRKVGPTWISGERVRILGVPSTFLVFSSNPVHELLNREAIRQRHLDEDSVASRLQVQSRFLAGADLRRQYLDFKKAAGAVGFHDRSIRLRANSRGGTDFSLNFPWPKEAAPGEYRVAVYEVRGREVSREWSTALSAERVGFAADFASFAAEHGSLYGIVAVFAGILVGFGIDFVATRMFGRKRVVAHERELPHPHPHGV